LWEKTWFTHTFFRERTQWPSELAEITENYEGER